MNLAVDVPGSARKFDKVKGGRYHAVLNMMGIATKADGTVAARFSDALDLELDKKQLDDLSPATPITTRTSSILRADNTRLKIAVNTGDKFGKFEVPLIVDPYDKAQFSMSDLAFSKEFHKASEMAQNLDSDLLQDRTPLVTQGLQLVPSASNRVQEVRARRGLP